LEFGHHTVISATTAGALHSLALSLHTQLGPQKLSLIDRNLSMKFTASVLGLLATATAHTQEEINKKGAEVMEEYRRDRGHWIHLSDMTHIDHMCG
jgi:hypothetical protein